MKKNSLKLVMAFFALVIAFSGCKKGEDDPFLSLRSRTARLAGEWKLSSADLSVTSGSSTYHYVYNGSILTITNTYSGHSSTDTYSYTESFTIDKDGTYSKSYTEDGETSSENGVWIWVEDNKELELANKEAFIVSRTSETSDGSTVTYSGATLQPDAMNVIKKLANKEMVIVFDETQVDGGSTSTVKGTYTYTQD